MVALAGPGWRLAPCHVSLVRETDQRAPARSTAADGSIGDAAHSSRDSDHNPDEQGWVDAVDITDDPANGCDVQELIDGIVARRDRRLGYAIHKRTIWRGYDKPGIPAFTPSPYTGENPHDHHAHISADDNHRGDTSPWWSPPIHDTEDFELNDDDRQWFREMFEIGLGKRELINVRPRSEVWRRTFESLEANRRILAKVAAIESAVTQLADGAIDYGKVQAAAESALREVLGELDS